MTTYVFLHCFNSLHNFVKVKTMRYNMTFPEGPALRWNDYI